MLLLIKRIFINKRPSSYYAAARHVYIFLYLIRSESKYQGQFIIYLNYFLSIASSGQKYLEILYDNIRTYMYNIPLICATFTIIYVIIVSRARIHFNNKRFYFNPNKRSDSGRMFFSRIFSVFIAQANP